MTTLQNPTSAAGRVAVGDGLLGAARGASTAKVRAPLTAFSSAHRVSAWRPAHGRVERRPGDGPRLGCRHRDAAA